MNPLEKLLAARIAAEGPVDVGTLMDMALGHPEHGYYRNRDPLGRGGDFTTAPEISQIFGELIGVWVADIWHQMGSPKKMVLMECGPGRGTLMVDALRATKRMAKFQDSLEIHLLETSPVLRELQKKNLHGHTLHFHEKFPEQKFGSPVIIIGNEFLDALPVRQLVRRGSGWVERAIIVAPDRGFAFTEIPSYSHEHTGKYAWPEAREGEIVEVSPARDAFIKNVLQALGGGGGALFIDYGHTKSAPGDTLQAVRAHKYTDVLKNIGQADLTAHVDFDSISRLSQEAGAAVFGPITQSRFLLSLGLTERAETLMRTAQATHSPAEQNALEEIKSAVLRLSGPAGMGQLFKAICMTHDPSLRPAGF